ncbi:MAG TPA: hypothetical protein VN679_10290, partial [Candidatus Acidoferrales bacterium]|nr:hypothetical protein [Candidatus Acidoferrales bacterium]
FFVLYLCFRLDTLVVGSHPYSRRVMKSQAETAGRLTNSSGARPQRGTVLRDLEVSMADGTRRLLSSVRGTSSLILIFTAGQDLSAFLATLLARKSTLIQNNARVLVVAAKQMQLAELSKWQDNLCLLALDQNGELHRALGATDGQENPVPTIYITDRFGEVFAAFRSENPTSLAGMDEIIRWLEFIEQQCEECSPSEWPE